MLATVPGVTVVNLQIAAGGEQYVSIQGMIQAGDFSGFGDMETSYLRFASSESLPFLREFARLVLDPANRPLAFGCTAGNQIHRKCLPNQMSYQLFFISLVINLDFLWPHSVRAEAGPRVRRPAGTCRRAGRPFFCARRQAGRRAHLRGNGERGKC